MNDFTRSRTADTRLRTIDRGGTLSSSRLLRVSRGEPLNPAQRLQC